jgi:small subunit ribosomal protein S1
MSESFAEMFEESLANQDLRRGAVVTGTVVDIQSDNVIVHAGLKSEGIIPIEQFRNTQGDLEVEVGDEVEVSLEAVEDGFGETRLSREKAKRDQVWRRLEEAFEKEEIVKGVISGKVKGGFTVDIDDIRAFLPGSLVDVRPVRDPAYLEGKDLEFKVIKLDKRRNNVVVSRRAVVETEFSAEREATSVVSMACCTSPTWHGSASSIRPRLSMSATKSTSRCSSSIASATGFRLA